MTRMSERRFVDELPDLIDPAEYAGDPRGRRVRLRLRLDGDGLELLGDAPRPQELEALLEGLGPAAIERTLCG